MAEAVAGFDWDAGNREKCRKHGVPLSEIEALFAGELAVWPDPAHSITEARFLAIGRTSAGRHVLVVFTFRECRSGRLIRPIGARYMHRKEVERYEQQAASGTKK